MLAALSEIGPNFGLFIVIGAMAVPVLAIVDASVAGLGVLWCAFQQDRMGDRSRWGNGAGYRGVPWRLVSPGSAAEGEAADRSARTRTFVMPTTHQPDQAVFRSVLPEDVDWEPFAAFPPSARLAVLVGHPSEPGPYVVRVKVPSGVKLMPHRHDEDRVYTVISGVFYIGRGEQFDEEKLEAFPPGSVVVLPGDTPTFTGQSQANTSLRSLPSGRSASTTPTPETTHGTELVSGDESVRSKRRRRRARLQFRRGDSGLEPDVLVPHLGVGRNEVTQ